MLRLERERDHVDVVTDQLGSPTYAGDLADALLDLAERGDAPPLLHATNAGQASWFDLARLRSRAWAPTRSGCGRPQCDVRPACPETRVFGALGPRVDRRRTAAAAGLARGPGRRTRQSWLIPR